MIAADQMIGPHGPLYAMAARRGRALAQCAQNIATCDLTQGDDYFEARQSGQPA